MIEGIQAAVTIPVMAKCRIGHFAEAQVLQGLGVDYIDESEVLTPADEAYHVDKWAFTVPFVCGATNLGEALRRISEGAALIRSKGEAGTGNIVEAVRHLRSILGDIEKLRIARPEERYGWAKELRAPIDLVDEVAERGELPVPLFCAGGIATPSDSSLVMQLGAQAVFVGSGIFKSSILRGPRDRRGDDALRGRGDRRKVSRGLGGAMRRGDRHPRRQARRPGLVTLVFVRPQVKLRCVPLRGARSRARRRWAALDADVTRSSSGPEHLARSTGSCCRVASRRRWTSCDSAGLRGNRCRRLGGLPAPTCAGLIVLAREVVDGRPTSSRSA